MIELFLSFLRGFLVSPDFCFVRFCYQQRSYHTHHDSLMTLVITYLILDVCSLQPSKCSNAGHPDWRSYIQRAVKEAGLGLRPIVLLLTESAFQEATCWENVQEVLKSEDFSNVFTAAEFREVGRLSC